MYRDPPTRGGEVAKPPVPAHASRTGSLWRDDVARNFPFSDVRARFMGDLLTVVIVEDSSGTKEADTATSNETSVLEGITQFFGLTTQLADKNPTIDPSKLIQADSKREWEGEGSTSRKGRLQARITVQVTAVAPNGTLWVEGDKIVAVNREDQHIALEGWVRPEDINTQNEVLSSRLALGKLEYYGVGVVGDQQREGWGLWLLNQVWPF